MNTRSARNAELGIRNAELRQKPFRIPSSALRIPSASNYLVGGVNSPVRAFRHVDAEPLIVRRAAGATITDVRGRTYVDFISGWGALILGHNPPAVTSAVRQALARGDIFGLTCPAEQELAAAIAASTPSVERVRFTASGTEACMTAVKLARAVTRRSKVLAFEGGYHGHADATMGSGSAGVPPSAAADLVRVPFNDAEACSRALQRYAGEFACIIVEPVAANMGVIPPQPGFLAALRRQATQAGALLIFDEVVTGFRLGYGGFQQTAKVTPDVTVFGKIIGGGLPIGALGGPAAVMARLAPEGNVYHGGTFAGHPLAMAAGIAALRALKSSPPYAKLSLLAGQLAHGLGSLAERLGIPLTIHQTGSMLTAFFTGTPVRNHEDARRADRAAFARWANGLREQGILVPPAPMEAMFLTTAHTDRQIDRVLAATRRIWERPA